MLIVCISHLTALAGDGPWTLNAQENNLYLGADYYRYQYVQTGTEGDQNELDTGLTATTVTGVWTMGLNQGLDGEIRIPVERVRANDPSSDFCTQNRPSDWCDQTTGIGDVALELKGRLLNEYYLSPVTVAVAGRMRSGETYSENRGRLTTLGDGQADVGVAASVGREATLGSGWYRTAATFGYWYRFANATDDGRKIPADEIDGSLSFVMTPKPRWAIGPAIYGFHRLNGLELPDVDITELNGFASLKATQIKAGLKVSIFTPNDGPTVTLGALRTVLAVNNPADTVAISVGIGWFRAQNNDEVAEESTPGG